MITSLNLLLANADSESFRGLFFLLYWLFAIAGVFLLAKGGKRKNEKLQGLGLVLFVAGALGVLITLVGGDFEIDGLVVLQIFMFLVVVLFFAASLFWH
ncbi:MAG: hypothetical protein JJT75_07870 [Opitutales bacterium]|nr:hypothetical protein [Opitutales bacterium]MCH8541257.1 hypothetical protein [Opitutales bacterium]